MHMSSPISLATAREWKTFVLEIIAKEFVRLGEGGREREEEEKEK